jgi:hypothetical protein
MLLGSLPSRPFPFGPNLILFSLRAPTFLLRCAGPEASIVSPGQKFYRFPGRPRPFLVFPRPLLLLFSLQEQNNDLEDKLVEAERELERLKRAADGPAAAGDALGAAACAAAPAAEEEEREGSGAGALAAAAACVSCEALPRDLAAGDALQQELPAQVDRLRQFLERHGLREAPPDPAGGSSASMARGAVWRGTPHTVRRSAARRGMAWHGMAWHGLCRVWRESQGPSCAREGGAPLLLLARMRLTLPRAAPPALPPPLASASLYMASAPRVVQESQVPLAPPRGTSGPGAAHLCAG